MTIKKVLSDISDRLRLGKQLKAQDPDITAVNPPEPNDRFIPLREAAQLAYDEADGTTFRLGRGTKSPEERLAIMATYLANNAVIFGVKPPSEEMLHIPLKEFSKGTFKNGGESFRAHTDSKDTYVKLCILEKHLRAAIRRMCAAD
jgi:hypothetical protein